MSWFNSKKPKTKKEEILETIQKSKIKKKEFVVWLEKKDILIKNKDWTSMIDELKNKTKPTNKELMAFIKSKRIKKEREKSKKRELIESNCHIKGHHFENKVAIWAKKYFKGDSVKKNILMNGLTSKRPYEIDVHVRIKGNFIKQQCDIAIECKNKTTSVKRIDIFKLVNSAREIKKAHKKGKENFYFDYLAFVSVSKFDIDALSYAEDNDIACFNYINGKYKLINKVSWL